MKPDDRQQIHDLLVRYCYLFDLGDAHGWSQCFIEDGVFQGKKGRFRGRNALREYATDAVSRGTYRHFIGNVLIEPGDTGEEACVSSYMLYYEVTAGGATFKTTAIQRDRVVRVAGGGWLIAERILTPDEAPT